MSFACLTAERTSGDEAGVLNSWPRQLPPGWLAAVVTPDLQRLDQRLGELLPPWGTSLASLSGSLTEATPGVEYDTGPWIAGLVETDSLSVQPFLQLPTAEHKEFCEAVGADLAGDIGIARIAGYDVTISQANGGLRIIPLPDGLSDAPPGGIASPACSGAANTNLGLHVSGRGLRLLAERFEKMPDPEKPKSPTWPRLPTDLPSIIDHLQIFGPVIEELDRIGGSLSINLSTNRETGALIAQIDLEARDHESLGTCLSEPCKPLGADEIAVVESSRLPVELLRLAIAYTECRSDEIEAARFPEEPFKQYAEALLQACRFESARLALLNPAPGNPLAANQLWRLLWRDEPASPAARLRGAIDSWNRLVKQTEARSPLLVEFSELPAEDSPTALPGWVARIDVASALGLDAAEVTALFESFYGESGVYSMRFAPADKDSREWIASSQPLDAAKESKERQKLPDLQKPTENQALIASGRLSIKAWLGLRRRIDDLVNANTLGRRVRPEMRSSDETTFLLFQNDSGWRLVAVMPEETSEAAAAHWRAEPQRIRRPPDESSD